MLIDPIVEGFDSAIRRTQSLVKNQNPIFGAGFSAQGAMVFADVMLPTNDKGRQSWRIVEVKSSASIKHYHRQDVAIQAFVARSSGVPLSAIALAHIDSSWSYPGGGNYKGLLVEQDLTEDAFSRTDEVRGWIAGAQQIISMLQAPEVKTGKQCGKPFPCGFLAHCESQEPMPDQPLKWLPRGTSKRLRLYIETNNITELRDLPDALLNDRQRRVKDATVSGTPYFDQTATKEALSAYGLPAYFLDFETINFPVPIWTGTRPYQQIPFQFSVHVLLNSDRIDQRKFLDLSGQDPSRKFAESLIAACDDTGVVFVYNAAFEASRIRELSERFPDLSEGLNTLKNRIVDLLPIVRDHYYHPSQEGSWSIKAVSPTLNLDINHESLVGVKDGSMAMDAFIEAIDPTTSKTRKLDLEQQLTDYCAMDTLAMVRLWSVLTA